MFSKLRASATAAHVMPLLVFTALLAVPGVFRIENPELPWYLQAPEHWVYPLQTLIGAGLLFAFRQHYQFGPRRGWLLAVVFAFVGIAVWIAPSWLYKQLTTGESRPDWWVWLGMVERDKGFDPTLLAAWPTWETGAIIMRFLRMVCVVPLVEEVMWRGFLMRYVNAPDGDWQRVPFGTHSWKGFSIVTLMVMLAHAPHDYLAAFIWASLMYFLAVRSRSLGACVLMHALGNFLLGWYALRTQQWGFW